MKMLYKYPQRAFPYADLVETNRRPARAIPSTSCSTRACSPVVPAKLLNEAGIVGAALAARSLVAAATPKPPSRAKVPVSA
jgi:hypothetical protein